MTGSGLLMVVEYNHLTRMAPVLSRDFPKRISKNCSASGPRGYQEYLPWQVTAPAKATRPVWSALTVTEYVEVTCKQPHECRFAISWFVA
jgi:hypothetical protein